jgi:monoterpene epsilon-lactone hydrolase
MNLQQQEVDRSLRSGVIDESASIQDQRAQFNAMMTMRPLPDDVSVEQIEPGGVSSAYLSPPAEAVGVLIYLHGGGYTAGSAETGSRLAAELVRRSGISAVVPDYRLAPEHPFPAAVEDGISVYRDVLSQTSPDQIAIAGDSAGGGLVVAILLAAREAGLPQPACAITFSAWTDMTLSGESMTTRDGIDPVLNRDAMDTHVPAYVTEEQRVDPLASPVLADLRGLAPLLVQVGDREVLLDDSVRLAARAVEAGGDVTLEVVPDVPHVFQVWSGVLDEADAALDRAAAFIRKHIPDSAAHIDA